MWKNPTWHLAKIQSSLYPANIHSKILLWNLRDNFPGLYTKLRIWSEIHTRLSGNNAQNFVKKWFRTFWKILLMIWGEFCLNFLWNQCASFRKNEAFAVISCSSNLASSQHILINCCLNQCSVPRINHASNPPTIRNMHRILPESYLSSFS